MKNIILASIILSLSFLLSCNNLFEDEKLTDNKIEIVKEVVDVDHNKTTFTIEQGLAFVMQTQKVLGKNLMAAIKSKGTNHALEFCKAEAFPLTDSMAIALNVHIKRVTDKPRNANNQANVHEMLYIEKAKELLEKGIGVKPEMTEVDGNTFAYYPILTNQACMQCHGAQNTEILSPTLLHIKELYPEDKAVDYKINELRGIWVVEMINDAEEK